MARDTQRGGIGLQGQASQVELDRQRTNSADRPRLGQVPSGAEGRDGDTRYVKSGAQTFVYHKIDGVWYRSEVVRLGKALAAVGDGAVGTAADGKSAYALAVEKGFVGDEVLWLESLHGDDAQATGNLDGGVPDTQFGGLEPYDAGEV